MKYDLSKRILRTMAKNPINDSKATGFLNESSSRNGDIKITREDDGLKLNVKYNGKWYEAALKDKRSFEETNYYNDVNWDVWDHVVYDNSVTINTYHCLQPTVGSTKGLVLKASMGGNHVKTYNTDTFVDTLTWGSNGGHTGVYGFKISKYNRDASSMSTSTNYTTVWEHVTPSMTPVAGIIYSFKVGYNFKKGDSVIIEVKGPHTSAWLFAKVGLIFKNKFNK
jgi:hypothetical protein